MAEPVPNDDKIKEIKRLRARVRALQVSDLVPTTVYLPKELRNRIDEWRGAKRPILQISRAIVILLEWALKHKDAKL